MGDRTTAMSVSRKSVPSEALTTHVAFESASNAARKDERIKLLSANDRLEPRIDVLATHKLIAKNRGDGLELARPAYVLKDSVSISMNDTDMLKLVRAPEKRSAWLELVKPDYAAYVLNSSVSISVNEMDPPELVRAQLPKLALDLKAPVGSGGSAVSVAIKNEVASGCFPCPPCAIL